jgi:hypothetical protein
MVLSIGICCAQDFQTSGENSWRPNGLFCFKSGKSENTQIHLVRYKDGKLETVFTIDTSETIQSPICLAENVIAVSSDGVIHKLDLNGKFVFRTKPIGFKGVSGHSGWISDKQIFMTEALWNDQEKKWMYYLYIVDILGKEPVVLSKFETIQPYKITRTSDEIVIVGQKDVQRLKLPSGLNE